MWTALLGPFSVGVVRWRSPRPSLTVIVKLTLSLANDGPMQLAATQLALATDALGSSPADDELEFPSDFAPRKARAEVLVVGHAHALMPRNSIPVVLETGAVSKRFEARAGVPAPTIPLVSSYLRRAESAVRTAPRRADVPQWIGRSLPEGFDYSLFNVGPEDQWTDWLGPGQRLVLEGLVPGVVRREAELGPVEPVVGYFAQGFDRSAVREVPMVADTLWIHADEAICTVVWRGLIERVPSSSSAERLLVAPRTEPTTDWGPMRLRLGEAAWARAAQEADLPPGPPARRPLGMLLAGADGVPGGGSSFPPPNADDDEEEPTRAQAADAIFGSATDDDDDEPLPTPPRRPSPISEEPRTRRGTGTLPPSPVAAPDDSAFGPADGPRPRARDEGAAERASTSAGRTGTLPPAAPETELGQAPPPLRTGSGTLPPERAGTGTEPPASPQQGYPAPLTRAGTGTEPPVAMPAPAGPVATMPRVDTGTEPPAAIFANAVWPARRPSTGTVPPGAGSGAASIANGPALRLGTGTLPPRADDPSPAAARSATGTAPPAGTDASERPARTATGTDRPPAGAVEPAVAPPAPLAPIIPRAPALPSIARTLPPLPAAPAPDPRPGGTLRPPSPPYQPPAIASAKRAAVWAALRDADSSPESVLGAYGLDDRAWRADRRRLALELAATAPFGHGEAGLADDSLADAAMAGGSLDGALDRFVKLKIQIDAALDKPQALASAGLSEADWRRTVREWRTRCRADRRVAQRLRDELHLERLAQRTAAEREPPQGRH